MRRDRHRSAHIRDRRVEQEARADEETRIRQRFQVRRRRRAATDDVRIGSVVVVVGDGGGRTTVVCGIIDSQQDDSRTRRHVVGLIRSAFVSVRVFVVSSSSSSDTGIAKRFKNSDIIIVIVHSDRRSHREQSIAHQHLGSSAYRAAVVFVVFVVVIGAGTARAISTVDDADDEQRHDACRCRRCRNQCDRINDYDIIIDDDSEKDTQKHNRTTAFERFSIDVSLLCVCERFQSCSVQIRHSHKVCVGNNRFIRRLRSTIAAVDETFNQDLQIADKANIRYLNNVTNQVRQSLRFVQNKF